MAKRIFISPVQNYGGEVGYACTVTMQNNGTPRPTRPGSTAQLIAINPDGTLGKTWGLVFADFEDQSDALAVPGVYAMPEVEYDARVSTMSGATSTAMFLAFTERGIPLTIAPSERAYRQVIRALGRLIEPGFDETVGSFTL
jgi:hypothetical protein